MSRCLCPTRWSDAHWREDLKLPGYDDQISLPHPCRADLRLVYVFRLVV